MILNIEQYISIHSIEYNTDIAVRLTIMTWARRCDGDLKMAPQLLAHTPLPLTCFFMCGIFRLTHSRGFRVRTAILLLFLFFFCFKIWRLRIRLQGQLVTVYKRSTVLSYLYLNTMILVFNYLYKKFFTKSSLRAIIMKMNV